MPRVAHRWSNGGGRCHDYYEVQWQDATSTSAERGERLSAKTVVGLTFAVWITVTILWTSRSVATNNAGEVITPIMVRLINSAIGAATCYPFHRLLELVRLRDVRQQIVIALLVSTVLALIYTPIVIALIDNSVPAGQAASRFTQRSDRFFFGFTYWEMVYFAWAAIYLALVYQRRLSVQVQHTLEAKRLASEARLEALRYQVDPHFLFNTLNSISSLVVSHRNDAAEAMIEKLASFFRGTLDFDPTKPVTLKREFECQRIFLDIERLRFPDMTVEIALDPALEGIMIPAAVAATDRRKRGQAWRDQARFRHDREIERGSPRRSSSNSKCERWDPTAPEQSSFGVGLSNVRELVPRTSILPKRED